MARPKQPLIDPPEVVSTALRLIDERGLDAFSVRKLAAALRINAASLYHHFEDKEAILDGVRQLVYDDDGGIHTPPILASTWQQQLTEAVSRYRTALLRHPNAAPLMKPTTIRPFGLVLRAQLVRRLVELSVPPHLVDPVIDSSVTLAYASSLLDPEQLLSAARLGTAADVFDLQLDALLTGWEVLFTRTVAGRVPPRTPA